MHPGKDDGDAVRRKRLVDGKWHALDGEPQTDALFETQRNDLALFLAMLHVLVRDGMQIVPNVTHVVGRHQKLFFYFEVYEPALADAAPDVRASLAFYRGKIKVLETPIVERVALDAPDRKAALFRLINAYNTVIAGFVWAAIGGPGHFWSGVGPQGIVALFIAHMTFGAVVGAAFKAEERMLVARPLL